MPSDFDVDGGTFDDLKRKARNRRLIPFVGAGFTKCLDKNFPGWDEVVRIAADTLSYDPRVLKAIATNYQVGEMLHNHGLMRPFAESLKPVLDEPSLATIVDNTAHYWLASFKADAIYTTNWDSWIERAFKHTTLNVPFRLIVQPEDLQNPKKTIDLIKFHGDLSRSETIIFAESGYHRRMHSANPLDVLLHASCLQNSILFLGYSLADIDLRLLWSRIQRSTLFPSAHGYLCVKGNRDVAANVLGLDNISVIGLDPLDPSGAITKLLKTLVQEQP